MSTFLSFAHPGRDMRRLPFIGWTGICLAAAYTLLRLVLLNTTGSFVFPDAWQFLDPLGLIISNGDRLTWTLCVHGALTIALLILGVRRSRDAGWRPWIGALMVLPVVRLFIFTALAAVPGKQHTSALDVPMPGAIGRLVPRSSLGSAIAAILLTVLAIVPLGFLDVHVIEHYGLALFIGLPFLLGAMSTYLFNYHQAHSLRKSIGIAMLTVTITLVAILVLAMEGALCLLMAAPIAYLIALAGAFVGHALAQNIHGRTPAMIMLLLLAPLLMAFEAVGGDREPTFSVVTAVRVHASAGTVWEKLVAFSRMQEPEELLFRAGISYPVEARIVGTGVGACRYCQFNTGPFVEPITTWDEPHLLAFTVVDDPPPLTELSFYEHIDAPHVDGFFRSRRGQFKLIEQPDGSVLLEGTTWYTHSIWPEWYWRVWSDAILHRIHQRVLLHIKAEAERQANG